MARRPVNGKADRPARLARREFLKLTALATTPALVQRAPTSADRPVVVVGAGLAGLRTASLLQAAGRPVVVLEARERIGGRVLTIRSPFDDGLYAEAGAVRIAAAHRAVLRAVNDYGLALVPFESPVGSPVPVRTDDVSRLKPDERGADIYALLQRYVGTLPASMADPGATAASYAAWRSYDRVTWPEWLLARGASPEAVRLMTMGGDSQELSALYVLRQFAMLRTSTQRFKIAGGMDLLPRAIASRLGSAIRRGAAVVRVTRAPDTVRVEYEANGSLQRVDASRVVFAVPAPTLRQIEIRPRLSAEKERIVSSLGYYPGVRILLQSRTRFWNRAGLNGTARTDRASEVWDCTYDQQTTSRGILGASTGGRIGREMLGLAPGQDLKFGIGLVSDAFPEIGGEYEKGVVQQWASERWSGGAFATFRPGQMTSMMPDIATPEDRLHFAGEHTSSWMGWMEGALASAERVVGELLR